MRRYLCILLTGVLLLGAVGCAQTRTAADQPKKLELVDWTAAEVLDALAEDCGAPDDAVRVTVDREDYDLPLWTEMSYGVTGEQWTDCALLLPSGAQATELAVFRLADGADGDAVLSALEAYRDSRQGDFTGYAPDQAELAAQGQVVRAGEWVALLICADAESAARQFETLVGDGAPLTTASSAGESPTADTAGAVTMEGRYPYTQPGLDDMTLYDTAPILAAWTSGDTAALSDRDRVILEKCRAVIDQVITADMSDYEKEAAIYCWVTTHGVYDYDHYDPQAELDPDSYNPYGLLTNGKGVCLAFATTFQLFLDLLEVECITVVGASYRSSEDHAWNMVRLDGQWYCVDPTWDLNSWDESMGTYLDYVRDDCTYFNVTSQYMAETDHQWDYTAVPEAEG